MSSHYALLLLFVVNVLNYVARNVLSALLPLVQAEFGASDALAGLLGSALMWAYTVTALGFGYLADRWPRNQIIAFGVALWSLASMGSGWSLSIATLLLWRVVVGVGESAFSSTSPAMLADLYPPSWRNRALSFFYIAMPVGAGLGYILGGTLGESFGWRWALFATGAPGLLLALFTLWLHDPPRGQRDAAAAEAPMPIGSAVRRLLGIASFRWVLGGQILLTFAIGGVAVWLPTYLVRAHSMTLQQAGVLSGAALTIGSLLGTIFGGLLADFIDRWSRNGLIHASVSGLVIAAALMPFVLLVHERTLIPVLLVALTFFLFWHTGPVNALLTNVVPPSIRATSVAFQILMVHLFGDAVSPALLGASSDFLQAHGFSAADSLRWVLLATLPASLLLAAGVTQVAALWAPADLARIVGPHRLDS